MCNGLVLYGKKIGARNEPEDYYETINYDYTVNTANNTKSLKCGKSSFEDVNPLPGEDKQCFCDEHSLTMDKDE